MNYIVFDLESTCWYGPEGKKYQSEIIEIGAVKLNEKLEITGEFQMFIQPEINPILSDFCKKLTSIKQSDVNSASYFTEVLPQFMNWVADGGKSPYWLCSWGFYDKKMFKSMCDYHKKATGWLKPHISIKHQFSDMSHVGMAGMTTALDALGIKMEGTHHRGIDDARNITKIFIQIFTKLKFKF